jgi:ribonuclease VapC
VIFVDSSAIVAILCGEPERSEFLTKLERSARSVTSPIAIYEAAMGLKQRHFCSVAEAENDVMSFLSAAGIEIVALSPTAATLALDASARYGKSRRRPEQLNMGDCFAFAMARELGAELLATGLDVGA